MSGQWECHEAVGCSLRALIAGAFGQGVPPSWPQFARRVVVFTHQARIGINAACQAWGIGAGDEILAPAYNCGSEIDPLLRSGATVAFYRVDRRAAIDLDDLKRRVTGRTRAIYVTHYFGWPHNLWGLETWCRDRGILLFEDCALSLFSSSPKGPVGTAGDAAFFSFPKTLPTPDGGAWTMPAAPSMPQHSLEAPPRWRVFRTSLPLVKRHWIAKTANLRCSAWIGRISMRGRDAYDCQPQDGQRSKMPESYYYDLRACRWGISHITRGQLTSFRPHEIVARRRRNYQRLLDGLAGVHGVTTLFPDLPDGVCPLGFPALVPNRTVWFRRLKACRIGAIRWWAGYHRGFSWDGFDDAAYLKDHVLVLPVHQDMSDAQIDYLASVMKTVARTN